MIIQSNLSTTASFGTQKKRPFYRGGRSLEGFQLKLVLELVWPDLVWPLLTGGRYSEVAVSTGLTVHEIANSTNHLIQILQIWKSSNPKNKIYCKKTEII